MNSFPFLAPKRAREPVFVGIVSTVPSAELFSVPAFIPPFDAVEIRLDSLRNEMDWVRRALTRAEISEIPVILTARSPLEGGDGNLSAEERSELVREFLPQASFVDVEIRSVPELGDLLAGIRESKAKLILSAHHFEKTPHLDELRVWIRQAADYGADHVKLATMLNGANDLRTLTRLFEQTLPLPLSVMGMGKLGGVSRVLLAQLGSVFNYGWIDKPNAPGQWPVALIRDCVEASRVASKSAGV